MAKRDFYEVLGVAKGASVDDVKKAYRKLAMAHHPDRNQGDKGSETKFKEATEAYEVLSDPQKRQQYDTYGSYSEQPGGGGQGFGGFDFSGFQGGFGGGGIEDIFENFFGGGQSRGRRQQQSAQRGEDQEIAIDLSFEEAAFGVERTVVLKRKGVCDNCSGSGAAKGSKISTCTKCGGRGQVEVTQRTILGNFRTVATCDQCEGSGKVPEQKCTHCRGEGRRTIEDNFTFKVPAGIDDAATIRIRDKGNAGRSGQAGGDLFVHVRVARSKKFIRNGADIHTTLEVSPAVATLGDEIEIETLHGKKTISIPKGIQHGQIIKLKDLGVTKIGSYNKGDHYVAVEVKIPKKLSKKEEELYKELQKVESSGSKRWF